MADSALTPKRRWFRWSLRTMFVVVTVVCVWLGWQASIVHTRKAIRAELESQASSSFDPYLAIIHNPGAPITGHQVKAYKGMSVIGKIPWYRRFLGDETVGTLGLPPGATNEDRIRIQRAFPEAVVSTAAEPTTHFYE